MGLEGYWNSVEEGLDYRLETIGMSFEDFKEKGSFSKSVVYKSYEQMKGFRTLSGSGKVDLYSELLEKQGYSPLPTYAEPLQSPVSTPELYKNYPLILTSGARSRNFMHSQGRMLKTLLEREPFPLIQINPDDADARGISDSDWVEISSPLGSITMKASVTDAVLPGVVHAVHSRVGHDINEIIPDEGLDPISGFPPFKSSLCEVRRTIST